MRVREHGGDLPGGRFGERQAVAVRVQHDDVAHPVAVGLDRFVIAGRTVREETAG